MAKNKTNPTVVIRCIKCGTLNDEDAAFCKKCAERLKPEVKVEGQSEEAKNRGSGKYAAPARPAVSPAAAVAGIFIGVFLSIVIIIAVFYAFSEPYPGKTGGSSSDSSSDSSSGTAGPSSVVSGVGGCKAGSAPAIGNSNGCCSISTPYYWSSDGKCHKYRKCSEGYAPAANDPSKCCDSSHPYYGGSDNMCHSTNTGVTQSTNTGIINYAYTLVQEYQTALMTSNWEVIITTAQELEAYIEIYDDILVYDIYFEENMDGLIEMIDDNKAQFEEACHSGSYTACTTPVTDTATSSCQEAEQRFSQNYLSISPELLTLSYIRSEIGLIDDALSRCANIRSSDQIDLWNSGKSQLYAALTQLEQVCNSADVYKPPICN